MDVLTFNPFTRDTPEWAAYERQVAAENTSPLADTHATFARWLGSSYDLQALDVVLAAAAVVRLGGDPAWLLIVSGPGNAKTETVTALSGVGALVTSTIASEGALLSGTSKKEKSPGATGGLLRKIGDSGLVVIKDVTSILAMHREARASVLAALREVYDGRWERNVGTDGGRTLTWTGRIVLIGAVTSAYDSAHGFVSAMGDRFALVRMDSTTGRQDAGMHALANVGREHEMRGALASAAGRLFEVLDADRAVLTATHMETLLRLSDVVTLARTAVESDYRGEVISAHAPEMPTRFAKVLGQIVRGALALGVAGDDALALAVRVASDSMPPTRRLVLADLADHPGALVAGIRERVSLPRTSVVRALDALVALGLVVESRSEVSRGSRYRLSALVDLVALKTLSGNVGPGEGR